MWLFWLRRASGAAGERRARRGGFAETAARAPTASAESAARPAMRRSAQSQRWQDGADLPFPSTGPSGHRARMREKILDRGPDALADYELLEMLLFFAQPKGDTKPLAKAAINRFGSFASVLAAPNRELFAMPGFGVHTVAAIRLVQGAAVRLARAEIADRPILRDWDRLMEYLNTVLAREKVEQFRVLFLDNRNRLIADETLGRGTVNHTPVYPREVVKRAIELHATALLLVHNHPTQPFSITLDHVPSH